MSGHAHHQDHSSTSNLKVSFFLNLVFTVIEVIGGILTNSFAILADAVHDAGDCASLGLAWYFDHYSKKDSTTQFSYGYRRYRLLGGLVTGIMLLGGLGFVLYHAIGRILSPEPVHAPGMIGLAVLGIIINGMAVLRVKKGTSLTEKLVTWHLLEDVLGWVAVLIGAGIMAIWDLPIIDPLLSIGISIFVLWNVFRNLRRVVLVFLQNTPESFDEDDFVRKVESFPNVIDTHHIHSWSLDGESHVLTAHLVLAAGTTREDIVATKRKVRELLQGSEFEHVTLDVELEGEPCVSHCGFEDAYADEPDESSENHVETEPKRDGKA